MRRVKPDVSHRIRRQPSIFSVLWFRIALGVGIALVLALLVGPSLSNWFGSDLPRSLFLLVPGSSSEKTAQARPPEPTASRPSLTSPGALPPDLAPASPRATGKAPSSAPSEPQPAAPPRAASAAPAPSTPLDAPKATAAPRSRRSRRARRLRRRARLRRPSRSRPRRPSTGYRSAPSSTISNADRLVERLKGDGLPAATTSFEQSRVLYRVLLVGSGDGRPQ